MTGTGAEVGAQFARSRALAVLRVRGRALAVALLPAALAVVLLAGGSTGHLVGGGWDAARWIAGVVALVVLLAAAGVGAVVARSRPAMSPTVPVPEETAPDLYRLVRDLADRLDVPAPSAIALTPDCDSWLEDRTHPAHAPPERAECSDRDEPDGLRGLPPSRPRRTPAAPVLVIGSPFLWWMRVGELRAVLAPVVAGTGPAAHPDIAAARRFVRGLDAAVGAASTPGRGPLTRAVHAGVGPVARLLLRGCREDAALMERGVAAAAAERAQAVDYGLRIVAQEQVGLAYAGWDRLLTRVALPAWRMGRWPSRLDAGVVAALTELSRRDRLAEGFASRLGERPACDLLEEPGAVDEATSLLAARLFHGGPAEQGPGWAPVDWQSYPEEVVDRKWRTDAARLHRVLDALGVPHCPTPPAIDPHGPTLARVLDHLAAPSRPSAAPRPPARPSTAADGVSAPPPHAGRTAPPTAIPGTPATSADPPHPAGPADAVPAGARAGDDGTTEDLEQALRRGPEEDLMDADATPATHGTHAAHGTDDTPGTDRLTQPDHLSQPGPLDPWGRTEQSDWTDRVDLTDPDDEEADLASGLANERSAALAAGLTAELAREEAAAPTARMAAQGAGGQAAGVPPWDQDSLPLFPLQPPRTGRELLADHVTAMVCCAAMDTAGAVPGLDWLDGPTLLVDGVRATDLGAKVLALVEDGDPVPLRTWLIDSGIRPEKPVRLG
ncbi:hypothetical protein [Streptomyces sp. NPDC093260]|uniref:hypothetical protein n=1 Tax=Streptomyces sp. NPDC093260 TaxID=3155073 RepID=UPI0034146196